MQAYNLGVMSDVLAYYIKAHKPDLVINKYRFETLFHLAQLRHYKQKIGLPEEYRPGMPITAQSFELTKVIMDDLLPFKVSMWDDDVSALQVNANGKADLPKGYYYPSVLSYRQMVGDEEVWGPVGVLNDKLFEERIASHLTKPNKDFPVCNFQATYIRFAPKNLRFVRFIYLKLPPKPVYGTTFSRGYTAYDPSTSTELLWNDTNCLDILMLVLKDLGITIPLQDLYQVADKAKIEGV